MGGKSSKSDTVKDQRIRSIQENFVRERDWLRGQSDHAENQKRIHRNRVIETDGGITFARTLSNDRFYVIHVPKLVKECQSEVPLIMMLHGKQE